MEKGEAMSENLEGSQVSKASGEDSNGSVGEGAVLNAQGQDSEFNLLLKAVEAAIGELSDEEVEMLRETYETSGLTVELAVLFVESARKKKRSPSPDPIDTPMPGGKGPLDSKY